MILSHLLAVVLASSIGVTDWAEVIQKPSDLDTLNLHELYHAHKEDFIDGLYDHLYKLYLNHPSESDLSHLLQFKLRLEQDLSELATVDSLPHAMNAFDQSFSRIMSAGLSEGKYSLQGLKALVNTYDIHFYSDNRQMSEFLGTDYLEPRLRESTDPEGLLINARDLLRVLYRKHPNHIQKLHSQYKQPFGLTFIQSPRIAAPFSLSSDPRTRRFRNPARSSSQGRAV